MPLRVPAGSTILFQGDSVTDTTRTTQSGDGLGNGYVRMGVDLIRERPGPCDLTFLNRGVSGNRVRDLRARWDEDAIALEPDVVSVLIGVNDTWRRYDSGELTTTADYERDYRHILARVRDELGARLLLVEPFLVPVDAEQRGWREDLDPRIQVVRALAEEFDASLLAADGLLNQAAREHGGAGAVAGDGVHPTPLGHAILARAWADLVETT
jgi:lysophospholipase L1-like esterase